MEVESTPSTAPEGGSAAGNSGQLQIRLLTTNPALAVPTTTLSVPANITPKGLEQLVQKLLQVQEDDDDDEDDDGEKKPGRSASLRLQFVLLDDFLREPLQDFLSGRGDQVSTESVLEIHYVEQTPPPEPQKNVNHDDWVSGVAARGQYVLTACYDHTISLFSLRTGEKLLTIPGHAGPARDVVWLSLDDEVGTFASCAHDQVVMLYRWNVKTNAVECMNACKGHERSVDCLAVNAPGQLLASGSFDTHLKVWGAGLQQQQQQAQKKDDGDGETEQKKSKSDGPRTLTRTPLMTLAGHKEGISAVDWIDEREIVTASWDHTIKIWDVGELQGMKSELVGNRSFFDLSYSPLNRTILATSADRSIRLYDPRAKDGVIVKSQYLSHQGWVTCVDWCRASEHHFLSGGHDMLLKMWDARSYKTPLYDLKGHDERVLCCDWGEANVVVSGGADNTMKIFKSNLPAK